MMRVRAGVFVLALCATAPQSSDAQRYTFAESTIVVRALDSVRAFQRLWEREWIAGQRARRLRMNKLPPGVEIVGDPTIHEPRALDLWCYFRADTMAPYRPDHAWGIDSKKRAIASAANERHWVCPNWLPPPDYYVSGPGLDDERLFIDNALELERRPRVVAARRDLIAHLASALGRVPRDSVLTGQYIRMLVDNNDYAMAFAFADNCLSGRAWCLALRGYVSHRARQVADAEEAFFSMRESMSPSEWCTWSDIGVLLHERARAGYEGAGCTARDSLNEKIWWLADPLWSVPGNDRFSEQGARRVTIALHAALGRDERYNWLPQGGGDALGEMILRYGWMSFAYYWPVERLRTLPLSGAYGGVPKDVAERRRANALGGWRTTYEYSLGRVHVIPPMSMVNDPFAITNADWSLNAPGGEWDYAFSWWPEEHYEPLHPLVGIVDQQIALLRRQDSAVFAYATALASTDLGRKLGDSVRTVIVSSTGPGAMRMLGDARVAAQDRFTNLAVIAATPALISVEVPWSGTSSRGARARFGITPPPPLSQLARGEIALSDPVILEVPAGADALPTRTDSAIALMRGSTSLQAGTNAIGVYWETYNIAAGDSIEISVSVERRGGGGSPVTTSWREPQPGQTVRTVAGAVPIQLRSLILDITGLPNGAYTLSLSVRRGTQTARSARDFVVR